MSEDIPERALISEAERRRLRREKETPEERATLERNETKGEQKVRLKSMTSTYEKKKHSSLRGILIFLNSIFHLKLVIPWLMNNQ